MTACLETKYIVSVPFLPVRYLLLRPVTIYLSSQTQILDTPPLLPLQSANYPTEQIALAFLPHCPVCAVPWPASITFVLPGCVFDYCLTPWTLILLSVSVLSLDVMISWWQLSFASMTILPQSYAVFLMLY